MAVTLNVPTNLNLQINANSFSQPLGKITGNVKDFDAALAASNARVIAFGASTAVLGTAIRGFKELADATIEVEKNLTDINRVLGLSTNQLQKYSSQLFEVTKQTSSSFAEASKAALEFSRQGIKAEETLIRTKDALTLTRLAGVSTQDAVEALTATVNNFTKENLNSSVVLNKLVAVEQSFSVSAGDLSEALTRTGQAASEANVSFDQLNALVTTAQQTTARGGAVIGNALKSIFTRLQRSETLDQLEAYNIAVRDVEGNTLPAVNILQNFAQSYKTLASSQRAQLSEQVAGVYQVNILKSLVNDLNSSNSVYASSLKKGADATNEADAATAQLNQTLSSLLSQTSTASTQLAANIGKVTFEPLAKSAAGTAKSVIEAFNDILQGEGVGSDFANGFLKGIRNLLAGPGAIAAFYTLFKLVQTSFTYVAQVLPQIAGITTETQNRKNIEAAILQIMQSQNPISQELAINTGNQAAQANILLNLAKAQTAQYELQAQLAQKLSVSLSSSGVNVGNRGLGVKSSGGYIPQSDKMAEAIGARAGGYTPGQIVNSPVGGVMNTAESVKYVPGFAQPFINPPANSQAGQAHRQNSIDRTGVDPYASGGFVPNFAEEKEDRVAMAVRLRSFDPSFFNIHGPSQIPFKRKRGEPFQEYENRILRTNNFIKSSNYLSYGPTSSIDGYKVEGDTISLAEVKSDDQSGFENWTLEDVKRKFLRGIAENYNTGKQNQLTQALKKSKDIYGYLFAPPLVLKKKSPQAEAVSSGGFIPNFATLQEYLSSKGILRLKGGSAANAAYSSGVSIEDIRSHLGDQNWIPKSATANEALAREQAKENAIERRGYRTENIRFLANGMHITNEDYDKSTDFGDAYEKYAANILRPRYPNLLSNVQARLYRGKSAAVDALDPIENVLFEMKGGQVDNAEVQDKFRRVYTENKNNKYFIPSKNWEHILIKNAANGFIPNFAGLTKLSRFESSELNKGSIFTESLGSSAVKYTGNKEKLIANIQASIGRTLTDGEKRFLMSASDGKLSQLSDPNILARFINSESKGGFAGFAKGFIPNFAYQQSVMQLEENMSGNKAVFDTNPFPHVRNSGQPSFESAIADHGGLNQALSDSLGNQKMAGLMNKGFVPNFAKAPDNKEFDIVRFSNSIASSVNGFGEKISNKISFIKDSILLGLDLMQQNFDPEKIERTAESTSKKIIASVSALGDRFSNLNKNLPTAPLKLTAAGIAASFGSMPTSDSKNNAIIEKSTQEFKEKISKLTNTLLFAGPMIAGITEQFAFGNRKRTDMSATERQVQSGLSTGVTSITTGAAIGGAFGPEGAVVGAAIGAIIGLASAASAAGLSLEELAEKDREEANKRQAVINSGTEYINALKKQGDLKTSGGSEFDIKTASDNVAKSFNDIKDAKLAEVFAKSAGNVDTLTKNLAEYNAETTKRAGITSALGAVQEQDTRRSFGLGGKSSSEKGVKDPFAVGSALYSSFKESPDILNKIKEIQKTLPSFEGVKKINTHLTEITRAAFPDLEEESEEFKEQFSRFSKLLFTGKSAAEISAAIEKRKKLDDLAAENQKKEDTKLGSLLDARQKITEEQISNFINTNNKLLQNDFSRQLTKLTNDFQNNLLMSVSDPIEVLKKQRTQSLTDLQGSIEDAKQSIRVNFTKEIEKDFTKLTANPTEIKDIIEPALTSLGQGDPAKFLEVLKGKGGLKGAPDKKAIESLREKYELSYKAPLQKEDTTLSSKSKLIDREFDNNTISRKINDFTQTLLQQEAKLLGDKERYELQRRTTLDLEIDVLERKMKEPETFFGKGVVGSAKQMSGMRNQILQKNLEKEETTKSSSAQSSYNEFIRTDEEAKRKLVEANKIPFMTAYPNRSTAAGPINDLSSLNNAIKTIKDTPEYANKDLETKRVQTLEKLKTIQQEIIQGKTKEEEITKRINKEEQDKAKESVSFKYGLRAGIDSMQKESETMIGDLGKRIPGLFADGLVDGIKAAIAESHHLGEALMKIGGNFLNEISTTLMKSSVRSLLGSMGIENLFKQAGGVIHAQNGMFVSGTGSGDKYPAMLENGEYVLNRNAVATLGGPSALDSFNFRAAPRFATGGATNFELTNLNRIRQPYQLSAIPELESQMTTYGAENSVEYNRLRDEARTIAADQRQKKLQRQSQMAALIGSVVAGVASIGISKGLNYKPQGSYNSSTAGKLEMATSGQGGSEEMMTLHEQSGGSIGSRLSDTIPHFMNGGMLDSPIVQKYGTRMQSGGSSLLASGGNSSTVNNNNSNTSNAFNFAVNVDRTGKIDLGKNQTSYEQKDVEFSKNMSTELYGAVLKVIANERRFGGSLAGLKNK